MIQHIQGDCRQVLDTLPERSVHCCVSSPPYWGLRDYGVEGQLGLEPTADEYVKNLVQVFSQVRWVLKNNGTLWLNLGDSYASGWACNRRSVIGQGSPDYRLRVNRLGGGLKEKDLVGIPWRVAPALQSDGWYLRSEIIWHKPQPAPEAVTDRVTRAHEHIFLLSKKKRYFYDAASIQETSGANRRSVWTVPTEGGVGDHTAVFPQELIRPCIRAGCPAGGTVLDPFGGSGTTGIVAEEEDRDCVLIELNPGFVRLQRKRAAQASLFSP